MDGSTLFDHLNLDVLVKVGLIYNPHSRFNRKYQWIESAKKTLGSHLCLVTQSPLDISKALQELLGKHKISILAISGGDGTLHHVVNFLMSLHEDCNREVPFPPLLLLRGGTMNIVANSLKIYGNPISLLGRFLCRYGGVRLRELNLRSQPLLSVNLGKGKTRYGFVFGSELTARCLNFYEIDFGGGVSGLFFFLFKVLQGAILKTSWWRENQYLLESTLGTTLIDGQTRPFMAAVASTVDVKILRGFINGLDVDISRNDGMNVRVLEPMKPYGVIKKLGVLVFGGKGTGILDLGGVQKMEMKGSFSLDGEIMWLAGEQSIVIRSPKIALPFVNQSLRV